MMEPALSRRLRISPLCLFGAAVVAHHAVPYAVPITPRCCCCCSPMMLLFPIHFASPRDVTADDHRHDADDTTSTSPFDPAFGYAKRVTTSWILSYRVSTGSAQSLRARAHGLSPGYLGYPFHRPSGRCEDASSALPGEQFPGRTGGVGDPRLP